MLYGRIVQVLPKIISLNQSSFVKGRSIVENVLLAQEIIKDINRRNKHTNMVVKLDMIKAYDRVSWIYLTNVLRKFGLSEMIVDISWIYQWYSVSTGIQWSSMVFRGLKQGDLLFPILFIIVDEVLSRNVNEVHHDRYFIGYGLLK